VVQSSPQPVAAVFAVVNPLFRPIPLTVLSVAFVGWVLLTAGRASVRRRPGGMQSDLHRRALARRRRWGAAIGMLAGAITWLVAARWPIHVRSTRPT
jgi:hypothetical protein